MFGYAFISLDIIVILAIVALLIALTFKVGKKPILSLILTAYPTLLVFLNFPYLKLDSPTSEAIMFVVIYVLVFLVVSSNISAQRCHGMSRRMIDAILLTLSFSTLFFVIYLHAVPSLSIFYSFSQQIGSLIVKIPYGLGLIIPLLVVFLTNKNEPQ